VFPVRYELNYIYYVEEYLSGHQPIAWEYNWPILFLGKINTGTRHPDWGNLKFEEKLGHELRGTQTRERQRWRGPAATVNYRPVLSSESTPPNNRLATKKISREKKRKTGHDSQMVA
jgi:hypothetical protein